MKITEDVRKYANEKGLTDQEALTAGMAEKSEEFKHQGAEVYQPSSSPNQQPNEVSAGEEVAD